MALTYDSYGAQNSLIFTATRSAALITGNKITRTVGGRITSELQNINGSTLTNPNPAGPTATDYTYDGAGRLASAALPNGSALYSYAINPGRDGCANTAAGLNTNRTRVVLTPTNGSPTTTASCYNTADQLMKTVVGSTSSTNYSYDGHGNQTTDNGTTLTWDASDRLKTTTTKAGVRTAYSYDPLDRVIDRTSGSTSTGYAYSGFSDTPVATLSGSSVQQAFVGLPGGVMVTAQTSGNIWSYPDLHGNYTATTNNTGVLVGKAVTYDPWGQPTPGTTPLNNSAGASKLGAFGAAGKITDTTTNITIMGARPYNSSEARFLSVDPIEGGCANAYTYVFGDPIDKSDLNGQGGCHDSYSHWRECSILKFSCTTTFGPGAVENIGAMLLTSEAAAGGALSGYAICGEADIVPIVGGAIDAGCGAAIAALLVDVGEGFADAAKMGEGFEVTESLKGLTVKFVPMYPCKLD